MNLEVLLASFVFVAAQTNASAIGLGVGYSVTAPTGTLTAITPQSMIVGSGTTPTAKLYSSASVTLPVAPYLARTLGTVDALTPALGLNSGEGVYDIGGSIILPPGAYCCFVSTAAGTASSFIGNFTWSENPVGTI